jgi:TM2 domain-containing membrane protein YozV
MSEGTPQADWYPDPGGSGRERYWDGDRWTDQTRPAGGTAPPPPFQEAQPQFDTSPWRQAPGVSYQPVTGFQKPKSPAIAVLLTILWLGAGHFYAGRSDTTAIVLAVANFVLWGLFLFCLVGILGWLPLVIWASIDAAKSATNFNYRNNLTST